MLGLYGSCSVKHLCCLIDGHKLQGLTPTMTDILQVLEKSQQQ